MTSIANSCFVRSLACPLCTIQLETQILHRNRYYLSTSNYNIYTKCIEIDNNISIVDKGLNTVEYRATQSKGHGKVLEINDQLVHASLGIFGIEGFERYRRYFREEDIGILTVFATC
jgi:hypothetical protein